MRQNSIHSISKSIFAVALLLLMVSNSANALQESDIASQMKTNIDKTTDLLQNKMIQQEEKNLKIFELFDPIFDYSSMSKIALGKNWKKLSSQQKIDFKSVFTQKLKQSYIDKLQLYTDEKVIINKTEKLKRTRIKLHTVLIGKDQDYKIVYKFHRTKKNEEWLIYDVEMIGVSIMKTYRKQFSEFLSSNTFDALIVELNKNKTTN
ncbi:hypothetical protein A9Q76_03725 [Arcobacter sp. 31_11_sub10_T18]|nr:hypothetical protein A9Q76_03725 [Arcobacter sp. 31_11_sub10_T18]